MNGTVVRLSIKAVVKKGINLLEANMSFSPLFFGDCFEKAK